MLMLEVDFLAFDVEEEEGIELGLDTALLGV